MKYLLSIIITSLVVSSSFGATFEELQVIPFDTLNAQSMKIWFPVKPDKCKVKLSILDSHNKPIRVLLLETLLHGYYNIYWDKKDDSGKFVPAGNYKVATLSCDYKRLEPITVQYTDGEDMMYASIGDDVHNPVIHLNSLADSLLITIEIINSALNPTTTLVQDSIVSRTKFDIPWNPPTEIPSGNYYFKLTVNDFTQLIPFKYKK